MYLNLSKKRCMCFVGDPLVDLIRRVNNKVCMISWTQEAKLVQTPKTWTRIKCLVPDTLDPFLFCPKQVTTSSSLFISRECSCHFTKIQSLEVQDQIQPIQSSIRTPTLILLPSLHYLFCNCLIIHVMGFCCSYIHISSSFF